MEEAEFHYTIERDDTPKTTAALAEYLRTMACVHPHYGTRRMPTPTDDKVFDMAADAIERLVKVIKENWRGDYWRAVNHEQADEVRAILAGAP